LEYLYLYVLKLLARQTASNMTVYHMMQYYVLALEQTT